MPTDSRTPDAARPSEAWYGIIGKPHEPDHLILGQADTTMCGRPRSEMTMTARGMFTLVQAAESQGNMAGMCAKCILTADLSVERSEPVAIGQCFPDGSYEIPLARRLQAASKDGASIPRMGIMGTNKHSIPLTSEEAAQLYALLVASPTGDREQDGAR